MRKLRIGKIKEGRKDKRRKKWEYGEFKRFMEKKMQ